MIVVLESDHELNEVLKDLTSEGQIPRPILFKGSAPFEIMAETPSHIEKHIYELVDTGLSIKNTGFVVKGRDKVRILESVEKDLTYEEFFLRKVSTSEGVEDICIHMLFSKMIDYEKLLTLSVERDLINQVGCYLEIVNDIKRFTSKKVIDRFKKNITCRTARKYWVNMLRKNGN